jgi:hypothetical protein
LNPIPRPRLVRGMLLCVAICAAPVHAQLVVTPEGRPSYSRPIAVPPGVAGMAPKLGIAYSGGSVNGPLGLGWSVQGLSLITRCPTTLATDSRSSGVGFVAHDKLCLDGQRLVPVDADGRPATGAGTLDASGVASYREYRTELDSFSRIRAYGYANGDTSGASGPAFFKVWTKAGQVYEYGDAPSKDANTRALVSVQGRTTAMVWALARTSDVVGNFIDFKYEQRNVAWGSGGLSGNPASGAEWGLVEVQYNGNKVVFDSEPGDPRTDKSEAWHRDAKNVSVRRLRSITSYTNSPNTALLGPAANAVAVKTVRLAYDNGPVTGRSRLTRIQECAGGVDSTRCLPATTFDYSAGGTDAYAPLNGFGLATVQLQNVAGTVGVILLDANGDGRTDVIRWADSGGNQLWLNQGNGGFSEVPAPTFNLAAQTLFRSDGCYVTMAADFNGDGLTDLFRYANSVSPVGASCGLPGAPVLYLGNGDGSFITKTYGGPLLSRQRSVKTANCVERAANGTCIDFGNQVGWSSGETFYLMDVDGDGKIDIVRALLPGTAPANPPSDPCATATCTDVFKGDGEGGFSQIPTNLIHQAVYVLPEAGYLVGSASHVVDLDDDRLDDLQSAGNPWVGVAPSWRSLGDGNFVSVSSPVACARPIDFNGDGHADCLAPGATPGANALFAGTGGAGMQKAFGFNLTAADQDMAGNAGVEVADVNGDGRHDLIRWHNDPTKNALYLSSGDGTFTPSTTFSLGSGGVNVPLQNTNGTAAFVAGDFTGRGQVELLRLQSVGSVTTNQLLVKQDPTPPDQLVAMTVGSGATTRLVYASLTNSEMPIGGTFPALGPRYVTDRATAQAATAPSIDLALPIHVVASVVTDAGVGSATNRMEFQYRGLKVDGRGRGLLGFREVLVQGTGADGNPLTTDTQYLQTYPYVGAPASVKVFAAALNATTSTTALRTTVNLYCDSGAAAGAEDAAIASRLACPVTAAIQRPYLLLSTTSARDLDGTLLPVATTRMAVNATGDPTQVGITVNGSAAGISQTFTKTVVNEYLADDTSCRNTLDCTWFLGRVGRSTVSGSVPNSIASLITSAGTSPTATATAGSLPPLVLSVAAVTATQSTAGTVSAPASVSVAGNPTLPLSYAWTRLSGASASVTANPSSGSSAQTSFATTLSATLAPGQTASETWQVAVSDAIGRSATASMPVSFQVTAPLQPAVAVNPGSLALTRNNPGTASGVLTATASSGVPPYTYAWVRTAGSRSSVSSATAASTNVSAVLDWSESFTETWQVSVTDAAGHTSTAAQATVGFTSPARPVVSVAPAAVNLQRNAPGDVSAVLTSSVSGGVPPYTHLWERVAGTRSVLSGTGLAAPTVSASLGWAESFAETWRDTITDAAGNTAAATSTVSFSTPSQPSVSVSPSAVTVAATGPGVASGAMSATASGGVAPYGFSWVRTSGSRTQVSSASAASPTVSVNLGWNENLGETWQVTVTDAVGNSASRSVGVTFTTPQPPPAITVSPTSLNYGTRNKGTTLTMSFTVTNASTGGMANGLSVATATNSGNSASGNFRNGAGTCGSSLAPGASCTVGIAFDSGCTGGSRGGTATLSGSNFSALSVPLNASTSNSGMCQ